MTIEKPEMAITRHIRFLFHPLSPIALFFSNSNVKKEDS